MPQRAASRRDHATIGLRAESWPVMPGGAAHDVAQRVTCGRGSDRNPGETPWTRGPGSLYLLRLVSGLGAAALRVNQWLGSKYPYVDGSSTPTVHQWAGGSRFLSRLLLGRGKGPRSFGGLR